MTVTTSAPAAQAIWEQMQVWTVTPYPQGGWSVICDGRRVNWFPGFQRAVNEAQHMNRAETLRIARLLGGAS